MPQTNFVIGIAIGAVLQGSVGRAFGGAKNYASESLILRKCYPVLSKISSMMVLSLRAA